jgi:hypothetical protein
MMVFLSNIQETQNCFESEQFVNYKRLLQKVTNKIERWHEKTEITGNKEHFEKDEEYIELDCSPTKFDTSSEEEEGDSEDSVTNKTPSKDQDERDALK